MTDTNTAIHNVQVVHIQSKEYVASAFSDTLQSQLLNHVQGCAGCDHFIVTDTQQLDGTHISFSCLCEICNTTIAD